MEDVGKAVDSLHKLGEDFKIIETGNKRVICSVAVELNQDHMSLLKFAEAHDGCLTFSKVKQELPNYSDRGRFDRAIATLLQDGLAWEDEQNEGEVAYWFPNFMQTGQSSEMENEDAVKLI